MKNLVFTVLFAFLLVAVVVDLIKDEKKQQQIQFVKEFESSQDPKVQQVVEHIKSDWLYQVETEQKQQQAKAEDEARNEKLFSEYKGIFIIVMTAVVLFLFFGFAKRSIRP